MSDLFGNHIVGFPTRWLICICVLEIGVGVERESYLHSSDQSHFFLLDFLDIYIWTHEEDGHIVITKR